MLKTIKKAPLLFVSATFVSSVAMADVTMQINSISNCMDISSSSFASGGGVASVTVPTGTYNVYLSNNTMTCNGGPSSTGNGCYIDHVVLRGWSSFPGNWGFVATTTPTTLSVTSNATFAGLILDTPCSDNTGTATVTFKGPL